MCIKRRVVVTGMGAVTPIGNNIHDFWQGLLDGKCGIDFITRFDTSEFNVKVAAEVKELDIDRYMDKKEQRRNDLFCRFGMAATVQAIEDSGISAENTDPYRVGVITGSGIGGIETLQNETLKLKERGPSRVSPLMIPMIIGNILPGSIAIKYGFKGAGHCIVTACASGTHGIGEAFKMIRDGELDAAVSGGAEATITTLAMAAFDNMKALSTKNDPACSSTPFDKNRDGFVMGEGAAMLILEELEHARARGAKIYAEVKGYGTTSDAYHITSPDPTGAGCARAMTNAIECGGITPAMVDYINAHGTGTPLNDRYETLGIKAALGENAQKAAISSIKGHTGHMLGAAGAAEALATVLAIKHGIVPPTINLREADEELDLDYTPNSPKKLDINYALSNSLGFGGQNASILLAKYTG